MTAKNKDSLGRELIFTRILDAPRELVFKLWTEPHHLAQWWGPKGFTNPVCELDARVGGAIRVDRRLISCSILARPQCRQKPGTSRGL